jgi:hypothetical protein
MRLNLFFTETLGIASEIIYALLIILAGLAISWLAYL